MRKNNWAEKKRDGFSLVELMVIIAVIAILGATAVPSVINWLPDYRLKTAADNLVSRLQQAKIQAARLNAECVIFFDNAANSYHLVSGGNDGIFNGPPVPSGDDELLHTGLLEAYGNGVRFGPGNATTHVTGGAWAAGADPWDYALGDYILFDPKGILFETGYVYLRNDDGACIAVGTPTLAGAIVQTKWRNGAWD
ncbi:conserved hypothetical protein [uncultured Desulfobacterium sp.]|uniref:Type II secretion system protein H n=1 Tax=uncultured Desulfobacterium sp. TaxID=201089 RepID=A0A445N3L6_9BACT|nr:conserved hypothetical protein [uncultured Desulfobacterium sp.]